MTLIRLIVRHWLALVLVMGLALLFLGGIVWVSRYLGRMVAIHTLIAGVGASPTPVTAELANP